MRDEEFKNWSSDAKDVTVYAAFCAGWEAAGRCLGSLAVDDDAGQIYAIYPKKVGRGAALKAIRRALQGTPFYLLKQRTQEYADAVARWPKEERQYLPHPATWYNQERYLDDQAEWKRGADAQSQFTKQYN